MDWTARETPLKIQRLTKRAAHEGCTFLASGSFVIGENEYEDVVTAGSFIEERLKYTWLVAASGTGQSTLLLSMILQDLEQGRGLALLDPHGDLFDEVLSRIPAHRLNDIVVVDPADDEFRWFHHSVSSFRADRRH